MTLKHRFISFLDEVALMPEAPATSITELTTGGEADHAPRGAFQPKDVDRIEEILTEALKTAESLTGRLWDGRRHVAQRNRPYDKREWEIHILARYAGVRNRLVAAEESVPYYVIRDLRNKHGLNGYGLPIDSDS